MHPVVLIQYHLAVVNRTPAGVISKDAPAGDIHGLIFMAYVFVLLLCQGNKHLKSIFFVLF